MTNRNGDVDIMLERKTNDKKDLTTNVQFSRRGHSLDISILNEENTGLQIAASFPKESVSLKISHSNKGNLITDADMFVGLEQSKILKSRLSWRPRLMRELRINTGETIRAFTRSSKQQYYAYITALAEEFSMRYALISRSVSDLVKPFLEDLDTGMKEIHHDVKVTKEAFWRMYNRNEFKMQEIVESFNEFKEFAGDVMGKIMLGYEVLYNITMENLEDFCYGIYYSFLDFGDYLSGVYTKMSKVAYNSWISFKHCLHKCSMASLRKMQQLSEIAFFKFQQLSSKMLLRFDKWLRSYAPYIIDGYYYTKNIADKIRNSFNDITTVVSEVIVSNRFYIALEQYTNSVLTTIKAFRDYEYAESAQAFLNKYYNMQLMETIVNHPTVEYMSGAANSAFRKSIEVYHNLGMDIALSAVADAATNYVKSVAINSVQDLLEDFYRSQAGAKYVFTPERGYVSLEFALPAPRDSLMDVFDFESYPEYQKMMNLNTLAAEHYRDFCFWDYYYKFTKYFTLDFWLPAFQAHALISGNQHFITFDKKSYDFAGKCSYLLTHDFLDGNFTVVVNYGDDHMRKSLTILIDEAKIDIANDYKIAVNDIRHESPAQIGKTVIIREGPNVRIDNEKKGFSIVCNYVHDYCSVSVSGFYYGKTAGLFGTLNHEPKLDWMTPGRHLVNDVETFTSSWEVGQKTCTSTENFATLPTNDYRVQEKCRALFATSTSEFRACFKQVDTETYLKMCITDLAAVSESEYENALCKSAAAYFMECKYEGVALKMPKQCVRCEKQDGSFMTQGDAVKYPTHGSAPVADVVFLIEEKACNVERVKYLYKLAQGIEESYKQKGYKNVRYSVIGFGGDQIHAEPHVHTMDGWESGPLGSLESAIASLKFGDGPINMLEAIRFAASLNYRAGSTKNFVLVKCSICKSEELKAEYSELLRTLYDGEITLHILMEQRYEMRNANKNSKARRVIGVDKKYAYTLKDVKDTHLSGDADLVAQLKIPKDVCIPLALEVNGSTFDSQFLMETKKNTNKKFIDIFSRLVVRSSMGSDSPYGLCCVCLATEDGIGKSSCMRCVSEEMARKMMDDDKENSGRVRQQKTRWGL